MCPSSSARLSEIDCAGCSKSARVVVEIKLTSGERGSVIEVEFPWDVVSPRYHKEFEGVCGFSLKADATYLTCFLLLLLSLRTSVFITPSFRTAPEAELSQYNLPTSMF